VSKLTRSKKANWKEVKGNRKIRKPLWVKKKNPEEGGSAKRTDALGPFGFPAGQKWRVLKRGVKVEGKSQEITPPISERKEKSIKVGAFPVIGVESRAEGGVKKRRMEIYNMFQTRSEEKEVNAMRRKIGLGGPYGQKGSI